MQVTYNIATPIINKFVSIIIFSCHYQENPLQALPTFTVYLNGLLVYEMTKRMLDITTQASVLKILSFLELPFSKVVTHFL